MVDQGNGAFRSSMKAICQTSIDNCKTFSAPPDPVAGDKPVALVRKLSEKVSAKVLNAPVAEQAAGAPEVRTVFSAEEAQYEGWVEAFKAAAGQDEVPVADETVAEDALDMGLKAASSAVEVMGAEVEHEGELRAVGADGLHRRPVRPASRRVHALARPRVECSIAPDDVPMVREVAPSVVGAHPCAPRVGD